MSSINTNVASFDTTGYEGIGLYINSGALAVASLTNQNTTDTLQPWGVLTGGGAAGKPLAIQFVPGSLVQVRCGTVAIVKGNQVKTEYQASLSAGAGEFIPWTLGDAANGDWIWGVAQESIAVGATGYITFQPVVANLDGT
jgi:hypothetical protein